MAETPGVKTLWVGEKGAYPPAGPGGRGAPNMAAEKYHRGGKGFFPHKRGKTTGKKKGPQKKGGFPAQEGIPPRKIYMPRPGGKTRGGQQGEKNAGPYKGGGGPISIIPGNALGLW